MAYKHIKFKDSEVLMFLEKNIIKNADGTFSWFPTNPLSQISATTPGQELQESDWNPFHKDFKPQPFKPTKMLTERDEKKYQDLVRSTTQEERGGAQSIPHGYSAPQDLFSGEFVTKEQMDKMKERERARRVFEGNPEKGEEGLPPKEFIKIMRGKGGVIELRFGELYYDFSGTNQSAKGRRNSEEYVRNFKEYIKTFLKNTLVKENPLAQESLQLSSPTSTSLEEMSAQQSLPYGQSSSMSPDQYYQNMNEKMVSQRGGPSDPVKDIIDQLNYYYRGKMDPVRSLEWYKKTSIKNQIDSNFQQAMSPIEEKIDKAFYIMSFSPDPYAGTAGSIYMATKYLGEGDYLNAGVELVFSLPGIKLIKSISKGTKFVNAVKAARATEKIPGLTLKNINNLEQAVSEIKNVIKSEKFKNGIIHAAGNAAQYMLIEYVQEKAKQKEKIYAQDLKRYHDNCYKQAIQGLESGVESAINGAQLECRQYLKTIKDQLQEDYNLRYRSSNETSK